MEDTTYSSQVKIHKNDISVLSIWGPNTRAPMFLKETLPQLELPIEWHTVIVGDFNIPLSPADKSLGQS